MNEDVARIFKNPAIIPISVGIVAFGAGLGLGYILGKRNGYVVYQIPPRIAFNQDNKIEVTEEKSDRQPVVRTIKEVMEERIMVEGPGEIDLAPDQEQNLAFAPTDDEWDYEEELKHRSSDQPYVIHRDEFYAEEKDYTQSTLTYYSGDNILVDEDDTPIYNHESVVGPMMFGHGSGDPNVFHVRNDKRKGEYEILFDPGLYSVEVLGLQIEDNQRAKEIKHTRANRKFRME